MYVDNDGDLWFCGNNNGLYQYQNKNKEWKHYSVESGVNKLSSDIVTMVVQDDKGLIWIGTDHGGICKLNTTRALHKKYISNDY